jgi:hypothetical protein
MLIAVGPVNIRRDCDQLFLFLGGRKWWIGDENFAVFGEVV